MFDVVGRPETVEQGLGMLGHAGTLVYIGLPQPGARVDFPLQQAFDRRVRFLVSHGGDHVPRLDFPALVSHAREGRLDLAGMVTKTIGARRGRAGVRRHALRRRDPLGDPAVKIPPPVAELIGFEVVSAGDGRCTMKLEAEERHANPMGTLHGGILCDVADGAMGMAFFSTLEPGESFTTLELKINYLRPFWTGHAARPREGRPPGQDGRDDRVRRRGRPGPPDRAGDEHVPCPPRRSRRRAMIPG